MSMQKARHAWAPIFAVFLAHVKVWSYLVYAVGENNFDPAKETSLKSVSLLFYNIEVVRLAVLEVLCSYFMLSESSKLSRSTFLHYHYSIFSVT